MPFSDLNMRLAFGPNEITTLSSAFDDALGDIAQAGEPQPDLPERDVRRQLARGIIDAAASGIMDREQLKQAGLATLRAP